MPNSPATVELAEDFHMGDLEIPGVSNVQMNGGQLSFHVTTNHDAVLKALSRYRITKFLAEERSLETLFLEHYRHDESQPS